MTPAAPDRMLRLALTPRWLIGAFVLLVLMVAAVFLGRWQWDRTMSILDAERAAAAQPAPLGEVLAGWTDPAALPSEAIGRPVTVTGQYDADEQVIVTSRSLGDRPGVWVVTGLRADDGTVVAVLRGWLPSASAPGVEPPSGPVTVTGVLQPDEAFYADAPSAEGSVVAIASTRLAEQWQQPLLPGFVVLTDQEPPAAPAPVPVPPTVQTADVPFPLQNFFYAFQWWIFAAFGLVVYLRWLWIESRRVDEQASVT